MSNFRISIGSASCENVKKSDVLGSKVCAIIADKILVYKSMNYSSARSLSEESSIEYKIEDKIVVVTFFKKEIDSNEILLVVQAAYKTLARPNYISFGFIGKIIADGVLVNSKNEFTKPEDKMLWEFR